jgi:hypothetical protein
MPLDAKGRMLRSASALRNLDVGPRRTVSETTFDGTSIYDTSINTLVLEDVTATSLTSIDVIKSTSSGCGSYVIRSGTVCNLQSPADCRYQAPNISYFLVQIINPNEYNHVAACLSHRQVASCARASIADTNRPCGSRFFILVRQPYSWR